MKPQNVCIWYLMLVPYWVIIFWMHLRDITVSVQALVGLELHIWVLCSGHLYRHVADTYQDYLYPLSPVSGLIKARFILPQWPYFECLPHGSCPTSDSAVYLGDDWLVVALLQKP